MSSDFPALLMYISIPCRNQCICLSFVGFAHAYMHTHTHICLRAVSPLCIYIYMFSLFMFIFFIFICTCPPWTFVHRCAPFKAGLSGQVVLLPGRLLHDCVCVLSYTEPVFGHGRASCCVQAAMLCLCKYNIIASRPVSGYTTWLAALRRVNL